MDPKPTPAPPSLLRRYGPLLLLLAATALTYAALWDADFAWDDVALVGDNRYTEDLANIPTFFQIDLWEATRKPAPPSGYYRPLFLTSLALDRWAVGGLSANLSHGVSLAWHLLAVTGLFVLLARLAPPGPALAGAAWFALHPVQSEAVALIAARNDSMAAAFALLALVLCLEDRPGPLRLGCVALATLAGLLSKESMVLIGGLLLALDLSRLGRPGPWVRYGAMLVAFGVYLGLRAWAGVGSAAVPNPDNVSLLVTSGPAVAGTYAGLLIWPWPLTPARHIHYLHGNASPVPSVLMLMLLVAAAFKLGRSRRQMAVGLTWAVLAFLPTLVATADKGLLGERFLYLPMAGVAILLTGALPDHRRLPAAVALACLPAIFALQLRLPQWQSSESLWRAAHESTPSAFTHGGLGWYVNNLGDYSEARDHMIAAVATDPPYKDACLLLVRTSLSMKRAGDAVVLGRWALEKRGCPPLPEFLGPYAMALAVTGDWTEARRQVGRMSSDPEGFGLIVAAADRARAGDFDSYDRLAARWRSSEPLQGRVENLLKHAGEDQAIQRMQGRW